MLNFGQLTRAVQDNCDISDAQFAGNYSLCTFLLKMREYFRWEHDIPLSAPLNKHDVGNWLAERERHWGTLADATLHPLPVDGRELDPFDTDEVNAVLIPRGHVYSGGYGLFHKPQFFLGALLRTEAHDGVTFHISACEYAREITATPAMTLDGTVFVRQESLRRFLWEKIEEWRWKKNENAPLARAMACYPADDDVERTLERMTDNETYSLILHELGEIRAGRLLGPRWEELLAGLTRSKAEFLVRAVRDHVADCLVTIPELLRRGNDAALHFYFANFSGLRRELFPEAQSAYQRWISGAGAASLRQVSDAGAQRWIDTAQRILDQCHDQPEQAQQIVERMFAETPRDQVSCAR